MIMAEDFKLNKSRCVLCYRKYDDAVDFKNIKSTIVQTSKKSIKDILTHLSKCIKTNVVLQDKDHVCCPCYEKLAEYDEIMLQLIIHQNQLSNLLETSMNMSQEADDESEENLSDVYEDASGGDDEEPQPTPNISQNSSYHCSICDIKFRSKSALRSHLNGHSEIFQCQICGVERRSKEYLELHMNIHEGKSEYECRYCPKRYSARSHVIRHMEYHWDKKQFQCEKCGLRFSQSYRFYNHQMLHDAEEQPLVCTECGQAFKTIRTFKRHKLTHRMDRPVYPCEVCEKKFADKYTLKVHLKTHQVTNEDDQDSVKKQNGKRKLEQKEYSCIICQGLFNAKDMLVEHMAADHDVIGPILI